MSGSNNRRKRIVIIGAGIGGMTAAGALRQRGFDVQVYERARELGEIGAGLQVAPNAVKVIRGLGLEKAFVEVAAEPVTRLSLEWDTGSVRSRETIKGWMEQTYGAPYYMAHRADLHRLLMSLVPDTSIHTGAECVSVANTADGAVARFADGSEVEADAILGADGIHSSVRLALFGETQARFTNQICWRIIVPMSEIGAVADKLPLPLDGSEYTGWLGPTGHVIFYPLRRGELLNIFAGRVSETWATESWAVPSDINEMLEAYAGWNEGMLAVLSRATEVSKWGIYDRDPLPRWVEGRIALLGDAAHPMMPTLAQGAAISMEDGYAAARNLAAGQDDLALALNCYERERLPRASKVQLQARQQFLNNQMSPAPAPISTDWIYLHDATAEQATPCTAAA